jgi:tetratricopeptide (TPR) repeat protein
MNTPSDAQIEVDRQEIERQAKADYQKGDFGNAARLYQEAAALARQNDPLTAAEMDNNASVALLQTGDAAGALRLCEGTDLIFAQAGDVKRQAMALGNQAAAWEAQKQHQKAIDRYTRSADLLKNTGERELRVYVLSSLSALQLKTGKYFEAMASMQIALDNKQKLTFREKILKKLLKVPFQMLGKS